MRNAFLAVVAIVMVSASPDTNAINPEITVQSYGTVLSFDFEPDEDREPDGLPDDWNRRRGPGFPS